MVVEATLFMKVLFYCISIFKKQTPDESYIYSPEWLVHKGSTVNPKNEKDNKCFQYAITIALNYNKIREKKLESIFKKIKQVDIEFLSYQKDWDKFEQNNTSIALNVLFVSYYSEEIKFAYKSAHNYKRKIQVILLMINDEAEEYHYFAVKNLLELYSLEWLKSKKEAIVNGNNCFQNALNDALNYQNIERDQQRISQIKPYISKYNWEETEFPAGPKDWEKFEQNNKTIVLNILFVAYNTETRRVVYMSKYNHKRRNQVILLMITDGNKHHYLAISNFSALLSGKLSNHQGDFYYLNCFSSYSTKNRLKEHEEICNKHDSCRVEMPKWLERILKYNPGENSLKAPFGIYLDLECLLKKGTILSKQPRKILQREKT